jgi:hypothetical protein
MTLTQEEELWFYLMFSPFIVWFWIEVAKSNGVTLSKIREAISSGLKIAIHPIVLMPILLSLVAILYGTSGDWLFLVLVLYTMFFAPLWYENARGDTGYVIAGIQTAIGLLLTFALLLAVVVALNWLGFGGGGGGAEWSWGSGSYPPP